MTQWHWISAAIQTRWYFETWLDSVHTVFVVMQIA